MASAGNNNSSNDTTTTTTTTPPSSRILIRSKKLVELVDLDNNTKITLLDNVSTTIQALASDAAYIHITGKGVMKCNYDGSNNTLLLPNTQGVQMMHLSPSNKYLLTWERYNADTCPKNLKVWDTTNVENGPLACFVQKNLSRESWPYLQWTYDEQYCFVVVNNTQIRVYTKDAIINNEDEPRFIDKLQVPCTTLSLPQTEAIDDNQKMLSSYYFATFTPKTKDKPATASIYEYNTDKKFTRLSSKSLFQAEECKVHWSPIIHQPACLLTLQTAVDATGESYYGSSQLWLWNTTHNTEIVAVQLPQDGPVQYVQWILNPLKPPCFIVIAGKMPAMSSIHHGVTGDVTFLFGNNVHRNTISSSPHGRFICLGGFGNLAGGMGFWDINKKKLIPHCNQNLTGTLRADTTVTMHSWSSNSRYFLVATTAPRMNVDNGITLYKYTGEVITNNNVPWDNKHYQPNLLLEVSFIPVSNPYTTYPDRPQSPLSTEREQELQQAPRPTTTNKVATPAAATTKASSSGRYVPPSARNRTGGGTSLAERMRMEKESKVQGATKITKSTPLKNSTGVVGMTAAASSGKSKSKIQREKQKQKRQQQQPEEKVQEEEIKEEALAAAMTTTEEKVDPEKRIRKLKKTLKQIEDLKKKNINELNDDQKAKIASEGSILAELKELKV